MGVGTGNGPGSRRTQIRPGQVLNPSGRPKGQKALATAIQEKLGEKGAMEFVEFAFRVWRGEEVGFTSSAQRWEAMTWLKDNVYGKAPLEINLNMGEEQIVINVPDMSKLTDEDLKLIRDAHAIAVSATETIDV